MQEYNDQPIVQLNLAHNQRSAARDYHEYFVPGSIKLVLATWTKEKLDEQSINSEYMFRHRFGFHAGSVVRQQVVEIRKKYDFTDREIRWLRHSGQLSIAPSEAKLKPSWVMPMIGWTQITFFGLMSVALLLQILLSTSPKWQQGLGEIIVFITAFCVLWVLNEFYIAPWRTLKRSGALSSTARKD
jgi:hypothetical protein